MVSLSFVICVFSCGLLLPMSILLCMEFGITFCCFRELLSYTDGNIPLTVTDLDSITNIRVTSMVEDKRANNNEYQKSSSSCMLQWGSSKSDLHISTENCEASSQQFSSGTDGQEAQIALKLAFTLPASCYATMAIRELLKTSTSVSISHTPSIPKL